MDISQIHERMEVVGSDGEHVGTVDHLDGSNRIKMTRNDVAAGGLHHWISMSDVELVDDKVHLRIPSSEAIKA